MGRAVGLWIQQEALSVRSDFRPIVGCFDQEREDTSLQLATYVDQRVTEWATVVHRTLSSKVDFPAALIRALLLEVCEVRMTALDLLESLAEDGLFALVIDLPTFTKVKGLSPTDSDSCQGPFFQG